jgi:phosphate transport system substrate-binding protein
MRHPPLRPVLLLALLLLSAGCARPGGEMEPGGAVAGRLKVAGSTAMLPLAGHAAEQFMDLHPRVQMQVSGGGSFTGLAQVAAGAIDIGNSDVPAPPDRFPGLVGTPVAIAPFVFITHREVAVDNLTQEQLIGIFTGTITNWRQVGGRDAPITVIHRPTSSGTRAAIRAVVMEGREFSAQATTQDSNGKVLAAISTTPHSIGYLDASYVDRQRIKVLKYNGVEFTPQSVKNGSYPVISRVLMYTKGEPGPLARAFLDYVLSEEFQESVLPQLGFVSVR